MGVAAERLGSSGLLIKVSGRLGLGVQQDFQRAYQPFLKGIDLCEIDLFSCTGIDSSGMALLLILRNHLNLESAQFLITHCSPDVYKVLGYANFQELFTVKPL